MKYRLDIKITEKDYVDYNIFWITKSPYGKKQLNSFRFFSLFACAVAVCVEMRILGFSGETLLRTVPIIIFGVIVELLAPRILGSSTKSQLKKLKKKGRLAYTPESVMEFYEDSFTEWTEEAKAEQKYSVVERISIVENKMIYIHVNNLMAFLIPVSSFGSQSEYQSFVEFIKSKCSTIDVY